jgi:ribosomal protein S18 acetylase RimI-like enzyme
MQRSLHNFRPPVDRRTTMVRRNYHIVEDQDPLASTWWEACTLGTTNRRIFRLVDRKTNAVRGNISYWDVEPLARNWGVRAMGLFDLSVDKSVRSGGLGTFLVVESLRHMHQQGITLVEAQVEEDNLPAKSLFEKMGFGTIDRGMVLGREIAVEAGLA